MPPFILNIKSTRSFLFILLISLVLVVWLITPLVVAPPLSGARIEIKKYTNGEDADIAPGPQIPVGANVIWTYDVTNLGEVTISGIQVWDDDQSLKVTCPSNNLTPGNSMICTANGTALKGGQYKNIGCVLGSYAFLSYGPTILIRATEKLTGSVSDCDVSHYIGTERVPEITIEKYISADGGLTWRDVSSPTDPDLPSILPGEKIYYRYVINNTGDFLLQDVTVTDDAGIPVNCPETSGKKNKIQKFYPHNSTECFAQDVAVNLCPFQNVVTVTGYHGNTVVRDEDAIYYCGYTPGSLKVCKIEVLNETYEEPYLSGWQMNVTGPGGYSAHQVTNAIDGCTMFTSLAVGDYTLMESNGGEWMPVTAAPIVVKIESGRQENRIFKNIKKENLGNLTVCKYNLSTPYPDGWQMNVTGPFEYRETQTTGAEGCTKFTHLIPGTYTISEDSLGGWVNLTSNRTIEIVKRGSDERVTFTNARESDLTTLHVCKFNFTEPYVDGWSITVTRATYNKTQMTDGEGCAIFRDLISGLEYQVTEENRTGWRNWTQSPTMVTAGKDETVNLVNIPPGVNVADLSVQKTRTPSLVDTNQQVTWTVTIQNHGFDPASNVVVTEDLSGLGVYSLVSVTPDFDPGTTKWTIGTLNPSDPPKVFTLVTTFPTSGIRWNNVSITASTLDPILSNNTANVSINVGKADLKITKTSGTASRYFTGDLVPWTITVTNNGPDRATNVIVQENISLLIDGTIVSANPAISSDNTWILTTLNKTETKSFILNTTFRSAGLKVNNVTATSDLEDPYKGDNRATALIQIFPSPDNAHLTLVKNVINNDGGSATPANFTLTIDDLPSSSGIEYDVSPSEEHTINEIPRPGYRFVNITGSGCPTTLGGTITLALGGSATCTITNDDLPSESATLSGTVFYDKDENGIKDPGESGFPDMEITLERANGAPVTNWTDNDGHYTFQVSPGTEVKITSMGPGGTHYPTTPEQLFVTPHEAQLYQGLDFGYSNDTKAAVIFGTVFNDTNSNGIQEIGENGLPGAVVNLSNSSLLQTFTTEARGLVAGTFTFTVDTIGIYLVSETNPPGYRSTTSDNINVDVSSLGGSFLVEFGDTLRSDIAAIYGTVFNDCNGNGRQDSNEVGLAGVGINVTDTDGETIPLVTKAYGQYTYGIEVPDDYVRVREDDPALPGYRSTTSDDIIFPTAPGASYGVNFGDTACSEFSTIMGTVFEDGNGNGIQDSTEGGIRDVPVGLDTGDTTFTDVYGTYTFAISETGFIQVIETDPVCYHSTTPNTITVEVEELNTTHVVNFGDRNNTLPSVSFYGTVFEDQNVNGARDQTEPGLEGVQVNLTAGDDPVTPNISNLTTVWGYYTFLIGETGNYTIHAQNLNGYVSTAAIPGSATVTRVDADTFRITVANVGGISCTLIEPMEYGENDFGDVLVTDVITVSGRALNDTNADGLLEGEPGLAIANVSLDTGLWQTTGGDGNYLLYAPAITPFNITEMNPAGYVSTNATPGDPNVTKINNDTLRVGAALPAGTVLGNNLFGDTLHGEVPPQPFAKVTACKRNATGSPLSEWTMILNSPDEGYLSNQTVMPSGCAEFKVYRAGSYTLFEDMKPGWRKESPTASNYTFTLDVTALGNILDPFYFNNSEVAPPYLTITACKYNESVNPEHSLLGWEMNLLGGAIPQNGMTNATGCTVFTVNQLAIYTLSETLPPGWINTTSSPTSYSIPVQELGGSTAIGPYNFVNIRTVPPPVSFATIRTCKNDSENEVQPGWRMIRGFGETYVNNTTASDGCTLFTVYESGVYNLSEDLQEGWQPVNTLDEPVRAIAVTVGPQGEEYNYTFVNRELPPEQQYGLVHVCKNDTQDNYLAQWVFNITNGSFSWRQATNESTGCTVFSVTATGTWTISEMPTGGWANVTPINQSISVDVISPAGTNYDPITFTNIRESDLGSLTVCKEERRPNGRTREYLDGWSMHVTGPYGYNRTQVTDETEGCTFFERLVPGQYLIDEEEREGWINETADPMTVPTGIGAPVTRTLINVPFHVPPTPPPEPNPPFGSSYTAGGSRECDFIETGELNPSAFGRVPQTITICAVDGIGQLIVTQGTVALSNQGAALELASIIPVAVPQGTLPGFDLMPAGYAYDLQPLEATFRGPVTLKLRLSPERWEALEGKNLVVGLWNPTTTTWEEIAATKDPAKLTITAPVSTFSLVGLFDKVPAIPPVEPGVQPEPVEQPEPAFNVVPYLLLAIIILLAILVARWWTTRPEKEVPGAGDWMPGGEFILPPAGLAEREAAFASIINVLNDVDGQLKDLEVTVSRSGAAISSQDATVIVDRFFITAQMAEERMKDPEIRQYLTSAQIEQLNTQLQGAVAKMGALSRRCEPLLNAIQAWYGEAAKT